MPPARPRRTRNGPTLHDVAKLSGVSIATVSRVVNENYFVSPPVAERVRDAIEQLDYRPDLAARSLKGLTTLTIGFVVSDISNSFFALVARTVEDRIHPIGYNLIVCSTNGDLHREREYLATLLQKKVDGLVVNTTGHNDEFVANLSKETPVVLLHRAIESDEFRGDIVRVNNERGAYLLTHHVLDQGHRRIGVVNGNMFVSTGRERFQGFQLALQEAGMLEHEVLRFDGDFSRASGVAAVNAWCGTGEQRPTAIIAMNNQMTIGVLEQLRTLAVCVPEDISIAGFGSLNNRSLLYTQPSIVTLDPIQTGSEVSDLLLRRLENPNAPAETRTYEPTLVRGNAVNNILSLRR
jgi:DNA-binding LacI/PurR family transcriptional regulator